MGNRLSITLPLTLSIILISICVSSVCGENDGEYDDGDDPIMFEVGDFCFYTITKSSVDLYEVYESEVEDLEIPASVEYEGIRYDVIQISSQIGGENIKTVHIPASIMIMTGGIFSAPNLEWITVDEDNLFFTSVDGILYDKDMHVILAYPQKKTDESFVFPETITTVGEGAFYNSCVKRIYMPEGMKEIEYFAFSGCKDLESINNIGVANMLPESISIIDRGAFDECSNLTNLKLPDQLKLLGDGAFANSGLTKINIPEEVQSIGSYVFSNCEDLETITSDNYAYIVEDNILYYKGRTLTVVAYPAACERTELVLDAQVTDIMPKAFSGCKYLQKIVLPKSMADIPEDAFRQCYSLTEIDLTNVSVLEYGVFHSCSSLKNVTWGDQLTTIGLLSFQGTAIEEIELPSSVRVLGSGAFSGCNNLISFTIPETSRVSLESDVFYDCNNLTEITIYSSDVSFEYGSLDIASVDNPATLTLNVNKDLTIPNDVVSDYSETTLVIKVIGERPYPYENIIGVIICLLIVVSILRMFRGI